jgi:hypothetical protein
MIDTLRPIAEGYQSCIQGETFEFSKIWLGFHFLPDFLKNQDLVEDITGRC